MAVKLESVYLAERQAGEICKNCRWWKQHVKVALLQAQNPENKYSGVCHFAPPSPDNPRPGTAPDSSCSEFEKRAEALEPQADPPADNPSMNEFLPVFVNWLYQRLESKNPPSKLQIGEAAYKLATIRVDFEHEKAVQDRQSSAM